MPLVIDQAPVGAPGPGAQGQDQFPLLYRDDSLVNANLGGKFALPSEFDANKLAAGFYGEGQEARSMEARQPVVGSPYRADGWTVWKYPPERETGKLDKDRKPIMEKHPMAGQPHKVAGAKAGENFVLMCRPADVQAQVNHVYGLVSIGLMTREIRGESLADDAGGRDSGMLPDTRLKREIGAEREIEEATGRSTAVHTDLNPAGVIERQSQRVSR